MLPPPKDSVGARILKKMGWRLGQGIGPRLTWHQRRQQDLQFSSVDAGIPDDEEAKKHSYAPRDTPILSVDRKDNSHGLGYSPGMGLHEGLGVKASDRNSGPKLVRTCACLVIKC
jgi:G patch domain-containing protein 1